LTGFNLESIIGAIVYLISVLTLLLIFMRPTLMKLIRDSKRIACKIVKI
jgi:hypothetical protein